MLDRVHGFDRRTDGLEGFEAQPFLSLRAMEPLFDDLRRSMIDARRMLGDRPGVADVVTPDPGSLQVSFPFPAFRGVAARY